MNAYSDPNPPAYSHAREEQNRELADQITRLAGHINAANYRFLKLVAEFDSNGGWAGDGVQSCAHWLSWKCGLDMGAAREKVRVAHKLSECPLIDAAFASGRLSYSVVRAITRVVTPATEADYLELTRWANAAQLEKLVRKHRWAQRLQESTREQLQHEDRRANVYQDDDGMWVVQARLPAVEGELFANAVTAILDRGDDELHEAGVTERDTYTRRRADALYKMAEHYLADESSELADLKASERCQVMLHVDVKTLQENTKKHSPDHAHCCIGDESWVHPDVAKRLSCDASLVTVLEDEKGNVLNIGRRSRTIPPSIKRAMDIRDQGCRFPGCINKHYVDGHHIKHWADGGETKLDNLVTLCRHHHRKLHEGEFDVKAHPTIPNDFLFTDRHGHEIEPTPGHFFTDHDVSAETLDIEVASPDVSAETCQTKWMGERMDENYVVDLMIDKEILAKKRASQDSPPPN